MLFAIAWILPIAEAADPVVCQPGEQSVCQASSAYGLLAGYSPTTNISDVALIDLNVRNLGNATDHVLALSIYETGLNYSLQAKLPTGPLDLRALSTQAKGMMFDCAVGCPLKHYQMYFGIPPPPPPLNRLPLYACAIALRLRHRLHPRPPPSSTPLIPSAQITTGTTTTQTSGCAVRFCRHRRHSRRRRLTLTSAVVGSTRAN